MTNQEYLKLNCQTHHNSIEETLDLRTICFDSALYQKLLSSFYSFYSATEKAMSSFETELLDLGFNLPERLKLHHLKADLNHFNLTEPTKIPDISFNNVMEVVGALYVLEGSTLGGQVISRELVRHGIITSEDEGGAFFSCYGNRTGFMWSEFKKQLNALPESFREDLLVSAIGTFTSLESWIEESLKGKGKLKS